MSDVQKINDELRKKELEISQCNALIGNSEDKITHCKAKYWIFQSYSETDQKLVDAANEVITTQTQKREELKVELEKLKEKLKERLKNAEEQEQRTTLKQKLTEEFKKPGNSNELITDAEWQVALEKMVAAELKNDQDAVQQKQAELAELIIERMPYEKSVFVNEQVKGKNKLDNEDEALLNKTKKEIRAIYGANAAIEQGKKLFVDDMAMVTVASTKWLAEYRKIGLEKCDKEKIQITQQIDECFTKHSPGLVETASKYVPQAFKPNDDLKELAVVAGIIDTNKQRIKDIEELYEQYEKDLEKLIKECYKSNIEQLKELDVEKDGPFKTKMDALADKLSKNIEETNNKEENIQNKLYAENIELFGLELFPSRANASQADQIRSFKDRVIKNYNKEKELGAVGADIENKIKSLEQETNTNTESKKELVIKLQKSTTIEDKTERTRVKAKLYEQIEILDTTLQKQGSEMQTLFVEKITNERQLGQLHMQIMLEKRFAMNAVPPMYEPYLENNQSVKDYTKFIADGYKEFLDKSTSIEAFAKEMQRLANSKEEEQKEKLFTYAAEVINVLPTLCMPDIGDGDGTSYSLNNVDNIVKSVVVINQAREAINKSVDKEPSNLYLKARQGAIKQAYDTLSNKILVYPVSEARWGFELLGLDKQAGFIQRIAKLNASEKKNDTSAKEELENEIQAAIKKIQREKAENALAKLLLDMGDIGLRIKGKEKVYDGIINYQISLDQLFAMRERLHIYLSSQNVSESQKTQKMVELTQIQGSIEDMQRIITTDLTRIYSSCGNAEDTEGMVKYLMNETMHCLAMSLSVAGGAIFGYGGGTVFGPICGLLSKVPGAGVIGNFLAATQAAGESSNAQKVGAILGGTMGYEAGNLNGRYDPASISKILPTEDVTKIEKADEVFVTKKTESEKKAESVNGVIATASNAGKVTVAKWLGNLLAGGQSLQQKAMHRIGGLINGHKKIFWGAMVGIGVAAGVAISVATMGVAAPFVAAIGVGLTAGIFGGGIVVGVAGALGLGAFINRKTTQRTRAIHKEAKDALKNAKENMEIKEDQGYEPWKPYIKQMNTHFKEQTHLVDERIDKYTTAYDNAKDEDKAEIESKIKRELDCLKRMATVKVKLEEMVCCYPTETKKESLDKLLNNYLDEDYHLYHREHLIDISAERRAVEQVEVVEALTDKVDAIMQKLKKPALLTEQEKAKVMAHKQTITTQFSVEVKKQLEQEDKQINNMKEIKNTLTNK